MTSLNFVASIECSEELVNAIEQNVKDFGVDGFMSSVSEVCRHEWNILTDADYNYLGFIAGVFLASGELFCLGNKSIDNTDVLLRIAEVPFRSFIYGIFCGSGKVYIEYSANHSAEVPFWKEIVRNSAYITRVDIEVSPDYPEDREEMGENWHASLCNLTK